MILVSNKYIFHCNDGFHMVAERSFDPDQINEVSEVRQDWEELAAQFEKSLPETQDELPVSQEKTLRKWLQYGMQPAGCPIIEKLRRCLVRGVFVVSRNLTLEKALNLEVSM